MDDIKLLPLTYPSKIGRRMANAIMEKYRVTSSSDYVADLYRTATFTNSVDRWTAERIPIYDPEGTVQDLLTLQWGESFTFGVENGESGRPIKPEPLLIINGEVDLNDKHFKLENITYLQTSRDLIGTISSHRSILQTGH